MGLLALAWVASAQAQVVVTDPWVRATVEGQTSTGAYMTLASQRDVALASVSAEIAGRASIHEMRMHDDMMTMRPVDRLPISAGHPLALDEGHYHVMLEDLKRRLNPGDKVAMDLHFVDAQGAKQLVHVLAPVRELSAHSSPHSHDGSSHD